ncbi:hypothetical protein ACJMK2_038604 [Sinanodonta woodiana]|uniref:SRCR domain-containing protein n=1 Tax=Sinanodonta woodiana TaxID=1069815 RepID=A0ABD3WAX3_SINWO
MVRLSGGLRQSQGRVEVLYNGAWGTVCDNNFDDYAATVVCRMLCYSGNLAVASTGGYFGAGTGSILLDNVKCYGNETSIVNCRHNPWGLHDCGHHEDAGVDCQANNIPNIKIRLAGGPNNEQGRVEIQYNGQWGTVCDDHWSASDAAVACRMLGLPFDGAVPVSRAAYGIGSGPILMNDVQCVGTEATLAACQFSGWTINDCKHSEDASVICQSSTASVQIRLTGGSGPFEGRLEVNYNGTWGTVCVDHFDTKDGVVVCRQLGYPGTGVITKSNAFFGPGSGSGSGPIWLDDLECTGLENNLIKCGHRGWGRSDCAHTKDASVICPYYLPNIQIRLAGGPNSQQGRVEIQYNGQWGTVCDDYWSASDAAVVCRMLGLPFDGAVPVSLAGYGNGSGPILMDDVKCIGTEATMAACQFAGWTINNCNHTDDAAVICQSSATASVPIRLTGGSGPYEGRLEVNYNGTWGTVCDDYFDTKDGVVVCRQLGYSGTGVITKSKAFFGPGSGHIWLDDLDCTGLEGNIILCGHRGWGRSDCSHSEDASVICP